METLHQFAREYGRSGRVLDDGLLEIKLWNPKSDTEVALEVAETRSTGLLISLSLGNNNNGWNKTLQAISEKKNLERLVFHSGKMPATRTADSTALYGRLLHTVATLTNTANSFQSLTVIYGFFAAGDFAKVIQSPNCSLAHLRLYSCSFLGDGRGLKDAIANNKSIGVLVLCARNDSSYAPFLSGLKENTAAQDLSVDISRCESSQTDDAVEHLLACTRATKLSVKGQFLEYNGLVRNNNVRCLSVVGETQPGAWESIKSVLKQPNSLLECLECRSNIPTFWPKFESILEAVKISNLKLLDIGTIPDMLNLQIVLQKLQWLKVEELRFGLEHERHRFGEWFDHGTEMFGMLHEGLRKCNYKLQALNYDPVRGLFPVGGRHHRAHTMFSDDQQAKLDIIFARNKKLSQWVKAPDKVPRAILAEVFLLAAKADEFSLLARLLKRLLEEHSCIARMRSFYVSTEFTSHFLEEFFVYDEDRGRKIIKEYKKFMALVNKYKMTVGRNLQPPVEIIRIWREHETFGNGSEYKKSCLAFHGEHIRTMEIGRSKTPSEIQYTVISNLIFEKELGPSSSQLEREIWCGTDDGTDGSTANKRKKI